MTLHWTKEDDPRWDAAKQRLLGPDELAAVGLGPPAPGAPVADEWWQVTGEDGEIAGYGWLDSASTARRSSPATTCSPGWAHCGGCPP
jgi:hypothetical protein